jgi:hypothetical protein
MYDKEYYKVIKEFPRWKINCQGCIKSVLTCEDKYTYINKLVGYRQVQFKKEGKRYTRKVHRLVAEYFLPPPPETLVLKCSKEHHGKVQVNHLDGNKENNLYTNLEWCDHQRNCKHASDTNLNPSPKGELNGRSELKEILVHKICKFYEDGGKPKQAQELFNISQSQATKIRSGHAWRYVWEQYNIIVNRRNKP